MGDLDLGPGDYHVSPQGSRHDQISSRQGALTYLRGTSIGDLAGVALELIGGLIPVQGGKAITVTTTTGQWLVVAEGVEEKPLWRDGQRESRFVRLAPGASLPAHHHEIDEECLVIEGDVFFGDILARSREFHLATAEKMEPWAVSCQITVYRNSYTLSALFAWCRNTATNTRPIGQRSNRLPRSAYFAPS